MHVSDVSNININVINNYKKFKKNFYIFNLSNRKQYSNFQVLEELSKIMKIKPKYELKQISKKESITQFYKSGDDISKFINYKNVEMLGKYITETGKIVPGRVSGVTSSQQRKITKAIKIARYMALIPYTDSHK